MKKDRKTKECGGLSNRFIVYCVQRPDAVVKNVWNTSVFINGVYMGSIRKVGSKLKSGVYNIPVVNDPRDIEGELNGVRIMLTANVEKSYMADGYILNKEISRGSLGPECIVVTENKYAQETARRVAERMNDKKFYKYTERKLWIETMNM